MASVLLIDDVDGIDIINGICTSAKCITNEIKGTASTNSDVTMRVEPTAEGDLIFSSRCRYEQR